MEKKNGITYEIAKFALNDHYDLWTEDDFRLCKVSILDYLSVALAGSREEPSKILAELMEEEGFSERCTVFGTEQRTSDLWAALINGTSAHVHDFDDVHDHLPIHLNVTVCTAAFAAAERVGASGKDLMMAVLNGMQVAISVAHCVYLNHYRAGWHGSATMGIWGAAAAAGYLLKLTPEQMCMAFGIVASGFGGIHLNFGTMTKSYHLGFAAKQGLQAALMAQKGFTANDHIMDTDFFEIISTKVSKEDMMKRLYGNNPIEEMKYKSFPCVVRTHSGIIGAQRLMDKYHIPVEEIVEIEQQSDSYSDHIVGVQFPQTGLEGKFSAVFCVCAAILYHDVVLSTFSDDIVKNPQVVSLLEKTKLVANTEFDGTRNGRTVIRTKSGETFEETVIMFGPEYDINARISQVKEKYNYYASQILSKERVRMSSEMVERLESVENISDLTCLLASVCE